MTAIPPVAALGPVAAPQALNLASLLPPATHGNGASFSQVLLDGIQAVNSRVASADAMVRAFAVDDSIPLHQVTFALEEARLSMELMMQVRTRLVEGYQRMMDMQL
jgi:flagellar hook-basal body complex protein FliE